MQQNTMMDTQTRERLFADELEARKKLKSNYFYFWLTMLVVSSLLLVIYVTTPLWELIG
jgi:hypothetical protein